jgi:hypothetical protein
MSTRTEPCALGFRRGWRCVRGTHGGGPCALVPKWWNLRARWLFR